MNCDTVFCPQSLSVVMPYYNNHQTLRAALLGWQAQRLAPKEIIIVDDGSAHPANEIVSQFVEAAQSQGVPMPPVRLFVSDHRGQSGATNIGIGKACGDIVLLSCSDIIPDPHLTAVHLQAHVEASLQKRAPIAVVGNIPYAANVKMTPFMRYLELPGAQFSFANIKDEENVSHLYCYAPNFSVSRTMLLQVDMFDENFVYGYQDTDLGKRLAQAGVRFVYRPKAVGHHDHFTTVAAFVKRQYSVGEATLYWLEKYQNPEEIRKMRGVMVRYEQMATQIEPLLAEVHRIEKLLEARPALLSALQNKLYTLYTALLNAAIVAGMLRKPQKVTQLLGSGQKELVLS